VACNFNRLNDIQGSKLQAVTYTLHVVVSRKRCKIKTLLLQTTNRKWYMGWSIEWRQFRWHWV